MSKPVEEGGFPWGMAISIGADIIISVGLAMQKAGHNRIEAAKAANPDAVGEATQLRVWRLGLLCMVCGEVGNLAAYADPNTPAAVVTAVGCVGVISSWFISTIFLKEPFRCECPPRPVAIGASAARLRVPPRAFARRRAVASTRRLHPPPRLRSRRWRDVMGGLLVIGGVSLIVSFAPRAPSELSGERLKQLLGQTGAIIIYVVYGLAIIGLFFVTPKIGHTHVVWCAASRRLAPPPSPRPSPPSPPPRSHPTPSAPSAGTSPSPPSSPPSRSWPPSRSRRSLSKPS